jgi:uncharacterized membrane protein
MEGLIALAVIFFVILPIVSAVMISGISSRVSSLENSISDLKNRIMSLDEAVRYGGGIETDKETSETLEPSPQAASYSEIPQLIENIESIEPHEASEENEEDLHETLVSAEILPPEPEEIEEPKEPEENAPVYSEPESVRDARLTESRLAEKCRTLYSWLIEDGNVWVTVGVMLFLAGFGLLFNYVHRMGWIPLEFRLIGAAAAGIVMTALGWRLRKSRRTYGLILQGGGIGILYIVLVAGVKFGPVVPVEGAVLGMLLLSVFTVVLALYQEFEPLALFALLGGYAAPILVSTGSQNFVALFAIHALLNFEVFLISLFRDWRKTRWGGLLASLAAGVAWGVLRWRAEYFASVEPFLILFYINYTALAMIPLFSEKLENVLKKARLWRHERADMPMLVTIPFAFLFLQMAAASHTSSGVAVTCLAVGALHLAFGKIMMQNPRAREIGCPSELFLVFCVIFSNLAIPFVFKQASASAIWAAEAAFLVVFAVLKKRNDALVSGLLLHAAAFVIYNYAPYLPLPSRIYDMPLMSAGLLDWRSETSPFLLTGLIFAVSALVSSRFISAADDLTPVVRVRDREFKMPPPNLMAYFFAAYGSVWWTLSVWHAIFVNFRQSGVTAFAILCLGGAVGYVLASRLGQKTGEAPDADAPPQIFSWSGYFGYFSCSGWDAARILAVPPLAVALAGTVLPGNLYYGLNSTMLRDLWSGYAFSWPAFAALFALAVLSYRSAMPTRLRIVTWGIFLFTFVSYTAAVWQFWANSVFGPAWSGIGGAGYLAEILPLCAATALLTLKRFDRTVAMRRPYFEGSCAALCCMMLLRFPAFVSFSNVKLIPPGYVPLLNTLELRQILYMATAAMLLGTASNERVRKIGFQYVLTFVLFLFLNDVAARSALRYFGERVEWGYMSRAPYFQGFIAILWGAASLACIFGSKRYAYRSLWFIGSGLLAVDILKLLMIDLRNSATVIRIFAFLILGGFFLLIGWAAPLPPKDARSGKLLWK